MLFQTATWQEYLVNKESPNLPDNVKAPVFTYLKFFSNSPRAVAGEKAVPRNVFSPTEGIHEAMANKLIDELGSDHHVAVKVDKQRRVAEQVSQIHMTGHPPLPATPSIGGEGVRRQLFPPMPQHNGMDEQAAVSLMESHESVLQLVRNLAGAKKVDVAERFQDAGLTQFSHRYYPPKEVFQFI